MGGILTMIRTERVQMSAASLAILVATWILYASYVYLWTYVYTHIHASSQEISDQINGRVPGTNPPTFVEFTADEIKDSVSYYGSNVRAYEGVGVTTIVFMFLGFLCLTASSLMLVIFQLTSPAKTVTWFKTNPAFAWIFRIMASLTIVTAVVVFLFSIALVVLRLAMTVGSTHTHLMASEWCDGTAVTWDRLLSTAAGTSCGAPNYDNDGPDTWGEATDCCSNGGIQETDLDYFCCMFKAPYDWGLKDGGAFSPFKNEQQDLRDGTHHLSRMEYILQSQFANEHIWKQSPNGTLLGFFDVVTFVALFELFTLLTIMSAVLVKFWMHHDLKLASRLRFSNFVVPPAGVQREIDAQRDEIKLLRVAIDNSAVPIYSSDSESSSEDEAGERSLRQRGMRF